MNADDSKWYSRTAETTAKPAAAIHVRIMTQSSNPIALSITARTYVRRQTVIKEIMVRAMATLVIWWPIVGASGSVVLYVQPILAGRRGFTTTPHREPGARCGPESEGSRNIYRMLLCARVVDCT